jgi:hypothetical protein
MIYFLVNNDYHLDFSLPLAKELYGEELALIQVPYSLKIVDRSEIFLKVYNFSGRLVPSFVDFLIKPGKIFKRFKEIDKLLSIKGKDILLVHTEIELLNQYIIQKFYEAGAEVYLLEDGTATMCTYNITPEKAPFIDRIRAFFLRRIFMFKYIEIKRFGIEVLPVMKDFIFKGVIVNYGECILRDIKCYKLKANDEAIEIAYKKGLIFFGQPLYLWFMTETEYVSFINEVLRTVSGRFSPFYFKFHPSDTEFVRTVIRKLIAEDYPDVDILDDTDRAEVLIHKFPVQYALAINSTAALNLINMGVVPIFLNKLLGNLFPNETLFAFDRFLESIRCRVPETLVDISSEFSAFPDGMSGQRKFSIGEILQIKK